MKENDLPKGFDCETCDKHHEFVGYVYAHWNERLTHTCECGALHEIRAGIARQSKSGKNPSK
jgi:transcription elongation factor Elf1